MTEKIRERGLPASKERVERLMHENGIRARHERRYRVTIDSKHKLPVAPNLLNREFPPTESGVRLKHHVNLVRRELAVLGHGARRVPWEVVRWAIKPSTTT